MDVVNALPEWAKDPKYKKVTFLKIDFMGGYWEWKPLWDEW